jgi:hypothetical protein
MKKEIEPFSVFWLPVGDNNRHYLVPDDYYGQIPWFVWGENLQKYNATSRLELTEECLLKGILYGLSPTTPKIGAIYQEEIFLTILDDLQQGFHYENREDLILNTAYSIKAKNGLFASLAISRTGMHLLPESSKIKSDYIMGLWEKACENEDNESVYKEILELVPKIDLDAINSGAKECICYYGFCSLFLLKHETKLNHDTNQYIKQYIDGIITLGEIQSKIDDLLNNPDQEFTPKELRVHDD